jgi:hypothetical protein
MERTVVFHGLGDVMPGRGTSGLAVRFWLHPIGRGEPFELEWESLRRDETNATWRSMD